ncbi:NACHT N-terminal Helical domain 1-containing protein [Oceanirhabdus sp. W0125-5]|uniref:NACHT N-terminal Helical domain 1-containing protein n=1 Tax=Oceanirhabdus sp. W0125-5 TaxID=2999116 RepID=UPI0022F2DC24|nr:NACHT domain-containing protein [Oceanirhabdus sp. W0125-5]WBW98838.1 NACHT domain-containing protein [Oceanirhabdus sp. W0125-5]
MILAEMLVKYIGVPISKALLNIWLKDNPILNSTSNNIMDILKTKTDDFISARKVSREFENIADKVGASLIPVFEVYRLEQISMEAVAIAVSNTIFDAHISAKLLAELSYNHKRLNDYILSVKKKRDRDFSEPERELYKRSIDLSAQYIIDLAPQLPDYTANNFNEILKRFDNLMELVRQVADDLESITTKTYSENNNSKFADFERDYRTAIIRKFDRLNLFGVDLSKIHKRYQLSVAYVSLDVTTEEEYFETDKHRMSVENALCDEQFIAIIGEAGTGKTTLLKWLAVNSARECLQSYISDWKETIPFIIELRRYTDKLPTPEDFIKQVTPEISQKIPDDWISKVLESGKALLLVDGLDEVPLSKREKVVEWLEDYIYTYNLRVVFTSRPAAKEWQEVVNRLDFKKLNLTPMSFENIQMFIQHWHTAVLGEQEKEQKYKIQLLVQKLLYKIQNSKPLMRLSTNPLLCAMICSLHYERNMQLPSDRSELYEACCSMLLERRDAEREIAVDSIFNLTYKQKRILLDDIAYWMLRNGKSSVSKDEAIERMNSKIKNMSENICEYGAEKILNNFIERSGIIREPTCGVIDFIHRTFQEYMAASAASSEGDWGLLARNSQDDQWHETIILAAGFANLKYADQLLTCLLEAGRKESNMNHDLLAMCCLETIAESSYEIREEVKKRINYSIPPKILAQCKSLAATGDLAVPFLAYKKDYNEEEVLSCIKTLGMITSTAALAQLSSYFSINMKPKVFDAIKYILAIVTPKEVFLSKLYKSLLEYIENNIENKKLELDGVIIQAISHSSSEELNNLFSSEINSLTITECKEQSLNILSYFSDLRMLDIEGNIYSLEELTKFDSLQLLRLKNNGKQWAELDHFNYLKALKSLIIISENNDSLPNFRMLESLNKLRKLVLISINGPMIDASIFEEISFLNKIEHLHIGSTDLLDFNFAPLSELRNLKVLELSIRAEYISSNIITLEVLENLQEIIINTDLHDENLENFIQNVDFCVPNCKVKYKIDSLFNDINNI